MNVIFFPRKDYDVEICAHRLGKKMTYTEQSDQVQNGSIGVLNLAEDFGIKVGAFMYYTNYGNEATEKIHELIDNNLFWPDVYFWTPNANPSTTSGIISEDMYNEYRDDYHIPRFVEQYGRVPNAFSYSYGNQTFKSYAESDGYWLGGRNSGISGETDYGVGYGTPNNMPYSIARFISKESTFRWHDTAFPSNGDNPIGISYLNTVAAKIDETLLNGGWLNNFTHWHTILANEQACGETVTTIDAEGSIYRQYFQMLANKNTNNEIYFAGYGEALAYFVYRSIITKAVMYSPKYDSTNRLSIRLETQNTLNVNTELLQVPISVKFSTSGTPLQGKSITSNRNLISLGNNSYIVEIPFANFPSAEIYIDN